MRRLIAAVILSAALGSGGAGIDEISAPQQAAIDRISPESLRGNLSFLASDALEGRATPSRGLDLAAEFIAAQFRRVGLEPAGPDGTYFQTARFAEVTPKLDDFRLTLTAGAESLDLTAAEVRVRSTSAVDLKNAPVTVLPESGALPAIEGRVVVGEARRYGAESWMNMLQKRRPALILLVSERGEPQEPSFLEDLEAGHAPVLYAVNDDAVQAVRDGRGLSLSVHLNAPVQKAAALRNVVGILRGSDPALRDKFIVVSAHYDHLGVAPRGSGDRIFNGANDNGSGTVSMMEIAGALASLEIHPRRSILFLAVFGEEEGLLGSYFYTEHPLVPLKDTVADINLEMMGRTDDPAGAQMGAFAFTGTSYSDLPSQMTAAAKAEGVRVYTKHGDAEFFARSDNYAFALAGVVAHTIVVAFDYPDYHRAGDEWQKIDYVNMAKVDKGVAAGILETANAAAPPRWSNSKDAAQYREAGK